MNFFTSFVTSFCASCVFIGALYILCPDGAVSRSVKYIFALVFILCVISASSLISGNIDFEFETENSAPYDTSALDTATAEYVFAEVLRKSGIDFSEITVCTDKTETGSICINKVIICSDCEESRIRAALESVAENTEVEIINE